MLFVDCLEDDFVVVVFQNEKVKYVDSKLISELIYSQFSQKTETG